MNHPNRASAIEFAAQRLRALVLSQPEGTLIGSEDALVVAVGRSRTTVKQAARVLEREGLLKVRRGSNGGYFAARPSAGTIEAVVGAHLETLDVEPDDATIIASALWVETMRKAASADPAASATVVERLKAGLCAIREDAGFEAVSVFERQMQAAIFDLARSRYVQLIFDINTAFFRRTFPPPGEETADGDHAAFVRRWRIAKQIELDALAIGDPELAGMAGRQSRAIWHDRVRRRLRPAA